jgi:hypothetical protein
LVRAGRASGCRRSPASARHQQPPTKRRRPAAPPPKGEYRAACDAAAGAARLAASDLAAALAAHNTRWALRLARLAAGHQTDELALARAADAGRRGARLKRALRDAAALQRLEMAHLEAFLESQASGEGGLVDSLLGLPPA